MSPQWDPKAATDLRAIQAEARTIEHTCALMVGVEYHLAYGRAVWCSGVPSKGILDATLKRWPDYRQKALDLK